MSTKLSSLNDKQNSLLNRLAYIDLRKWEKGDKIVDVLRAADKGDLADEFEKYGLGDLTIAGYQNDNDKTGFAAIAFEDSSRAVGMSFRGTEPDEGVKDMLDNIAASVAGVSPQILKALEFYEKYGKEAENVFLYGHSKGGDLALEVYVTDYNNIEQVHIINAQPIDDSKLRIDQKMALMLNKVDSVAKHSLSGNLAVFVA